MEWSLLALPGLFLWIVILLLPWRPWSTRESLDAPASQSQAALSDITVLIPARNEEDFIAQTLQGLTSQDCALRIILVDDQSDDRTSEVARQQGLPNLRIINGLPLADGWSGKLWALQQGLQYVETELVLLLDADIRLEPGILAALLQKLQKDNLAMISLMAQLRMHTFREKMLLPAFIFFFKLLYPFRLSNASSHWIAAAAGGCILVRKKQLLEIQAFTSVRGKLIDDCALARKIKDHGGKTWLGLTHSAISMRPYEAPGQIWDMVARTAFTQLHYSWLLLLACSVLMTAAFILPLISLVAGEPWPALLAITTLLIMAVCYRPVIRYYELHPLWLLTLPLAGILYLCMTWSSAYRHMIKTGAHWKNRHYSMTALK
ncbi:MAG TPA: glycosyltransferase [Gammaproteobacteria bacterium]|nr:glycosyltransferase [Gammaproteobacteria bacterium]